MAAGLWLSELLLRPLAFASVGLRELVVNIPGGLRFKMNRPSLDELLPKVDSRYTLVVTAAKRARQITDGAPRAVATRSGKPVTIALYEILHGKVVYQRPEKGSS